MKMSSGVKEHLLHFDKEFSPDIVDYATNVALVLSKYMFVTTVKNQQYGYCTHCNKESRTHLPKLSDRELAEMEMCGCSAAIYMGEEYMRKKHGDKIKCPNCGSECIVRYSGLGHSKLKDCAYFVYYEKSQLNPKVIVARGIYATRDYGRGYKNIKTELDTEVYYTFEYKKMGKMIKPISTSWSDPYHLGFSKTVHSWANHYQGYGYGYNTFVGYSRESIKSAVMGTPFAWSGWEAYDYKEMVEFFDLYSRYPVIEYLNKLGHKSIVIEKLEKGSISYNVINWKGKTAESFFKLSKEDYILIKQQKINITSWFLNVVRVNKEWSLGLSIPELAILSELAIGEGEIDDIRTTFGKYINFKEAFKYCFKQNKKSRAYLSIPMVIRDWRDYIFECKKLNMDISDMRVLFPKDLHKAHLNTTAQIRYAEDKVLTDKIIARLPELSHYYVQSGQFMLRPAESSFEIVEEGKVLNHCVGRYAKDYADGKTCILFIRKAVEPDIPFYTAEFKDGKIVQIRGLRNCAPEDEALLAFIEKLKTEVLIVRPEKVNKIQDKIPA